MAYAMRHAHEHMETNMEDAACRRLALRDLTLNGHKLDGQFDKRKYGCMMHGVGLCDEWPLVTYPDQYVRGRFLIMRLRPAWSCVLRPWSAPEGGDFFSIKLEDQVLVTEAGYEEPYRLSV